LYRLSPTRVYLFIEFSASACFSMMFVVTSLYEATVAGLTPVQLILVGTALEISAFVFEVPTGIVADVYSRRLSIIIGYVLMGVGFLLEGLFPAFISDSARANHLGLGLHLHQWRNAGMDHGRGRRRGCQQIISARNAG
jgi:MFS family permease